MFLDFIHLHFVSCPAHNPGPKQSVTHKGSCILLFISLQLSFGFVINWTNESANSQALKRPAAQGTLPQRASKSMQQRVTSLKVPCSAKSALLMFSNDKMCLKPVSDLPRNEKRPSFTLMYASLFKRCVQKNRVLKISPLRCHTVFAGRLQTEG